LTGVPELALEVLDAELEAEAEPDLELELELEPQPAITIAVMPTAMAGLNRRSFPMPVLSPLCIAILCTFSSNI
jgi:hypothetical protein